MTIKSFSLFGLVLFLFLSSCVTKKVPGTIIFNNDSIKNVTFCMPAKTSTDELKYYKICKKVTFFNNIGEKVVLKPDQAKEIKFVDEIPTRMISCKVGCKMRFLKMQMDGKVKLLSLVVPPKTYTSIGSDGMHFSYTIPEREIDYLKKDNEELFWPRWLRFRKDMKIYLSDCPELVDKIDKKILTSDDIEQIVGEYNNCNNK